jgi:hypothetical protein
VCSAFIFTTPNKKDEGNFFFPDKKGKLIFFKHGLQEISLRHGPTEKFKKSHSPTSDLNEEDLPTTLLSTQAPTDQESGR